jgi:hypothetical protein
MGKMSVGRGSSAGYLPFCGWVLEVLEFGGLAPDNGAGMWIDRTLGTSCNIIKCAPQQMRYRNGRTFWMMHYQILRVLEEKPDASKRMRRISSLTTFSGIA